MQDKKQIKGEKTRKNDLKKFQAKEIPSPTSGKEINVLSVPDYLKGYDEADHDWKLLYYAVKRKILGKLLKMFIYGTIAKRYRIIDKYRVETDNLEDVKFKDIYNGEYLIMK